MQSSASLLYIFFFMLRLRRPPRRFCRRALLLQLVRRLSFSHAPVEKFGKQQHRPRKQRHAEGQGDGDERRAGHDFLEGSICPPQRGKVSDIQYIIYRGKERASALPI